MERNSAKKNNLIQAIKEQGGVQLKDVKIDDEFLD